MPGIFSRPVGATDSNYRLDPQFFTNESFRGEYDASNNLIYAGFAKPGGDEGLPVWQIFKMTYDGSQNVLTIKWPKIKTDIYNAASADLNQPSYDYFFIWTSRASYTYV